MEIVLAIFEKQLGSALITKGKEIFNENRVGPLQKKGSLWNAEITPVPQSPAGKKYKISLYVQKGIVTDIFCSCGPDVCPHVIAVMLALRKKLKIAPKKYQAPDPDMQTENEPEVEAKPVSQKAMAIAPALSLSQRLNRIFYAWRRVKIDRTELEDMSAGIAVHEMGPGKLRKIVREDVTPNGKGHTLSGAKKILGAALLQFKKNRFDAVYNVANAVLDEVIHFEIRGNSDEECGEAAAILLEELYNSPATTAELKDEIFSRVKEILGDEEFWKFHGFVIPIPSLTLRNKKQQEEYLEFLTNSKTIHYNPAKIIGAKSRLLELLGRKDEAMHVADEQLSKYADELVDEAFSRQRFKEARRLVNEAIRLDVINQKKSWAEWLYEIALVENDIPAIRDYHKTSYFSKGFPDEAYFECRATYTDEEWAHELPSWIDRFEKQEPLDSSAAMALAKIYVREEMPAGKVISLFRKYQNYELAKLLAPVLTPEFEEDLLRFYCEHFKALAVKSHLLDKVVTLRKEIRSCMITPLSIRVLSQFVRELIALYPTKKGFAKELSLLLK